MASVTSRLLESGLSGSLGSESKGKAQGGTAVPVPAGSPGTVLADPQGVGHLPNICQVPKALAVSRGVGGDVTARGDVTTWLCTHGGGHAGDDVLCRLPQEVLVARDGRQA